LPKTIVLFEGIYFPILQFRIGNLPKQSSISKKSIRGELKQVTSYASFVWERLSCTKSTLRNIKFVEFLMPNRLLIVDCFNFW